ASNRPASMPPRSPASNASSIQNPDARPASPQSVPAGASAESRTGNSRASPPQSTAPNQSQIPKPPSRPSPQETHQ
ncbi:rod shape-determining protein MreC, partial [Xanthomonas oryzae pv. oryzae]